FRHTCLLIPVWKALSPIAIESPAVRGADDGGDDGGRWKGLLAPVGVDHGLFDTDLELLHVRIRAGRRLFAGREGEGIDAGARAGPFRPAQRRFGGLACRGRTFYHSNQAGAEPFP